MDFKVLAAMVLERIERAEDIAPRGTYEHGHYLRAALEIEWLNIRSILNHVKSQ